MGIARCKFVENVGKKRLIASYYREERAPIGKPNHTKQSKVNHGEYSGVVQQEPLCVSCTLEANIGGFNNDNCKHARTAVN